MLGYGSQEDVQLVSENPPEQETVNPSEYAESSMNPIFGRYEVFGDMPGGFGLRLQKGGPNHRYWYAILADCSQGGMQKGPLITTMTPATVDSTNGINRFFETGGSLFALNGRYALRRTNDSTWGVSKDFTAGKVATDVAVFTSNFAGSTIVFIAMGDSEKFYHATSANAVADTWTQHGTMYARAFSQVGREFWRASATNLMAKVDTDADPTVEANWTATNSFRLGSQDAGVKRIGATIADTMYVFKTDGIYSLDEYGNDKELFPILRLATDSTNGDSFTQWKNDQYVAYGNSVYQLTPDGALAQVGPETITDNDSPIKGRVTALCGTQYAIYAGIYNPDTNNSYLIKYEGKRAQDSNGNEYHVWHGSLSAAYTSSEKITALHVSTIGADTGHSRLYLGFSTGKVGYMALPCTPNPAGCSSYRYSTTDGYVYFPTLTMGYQSESKYIRAATMTALNFSSTAYAQFQYRTLQSGSYTTLAENFDTVPRERATISNVSCVLLDTAAVLVNTASTEGVRLTRVGVEYQLRTQLRKVFSFNVIAENGLRLCDGTPMRIGAKAIRELVEAGRNTAAPISITLLDEVPRTMMVISTSETFALDVYGGKRWREAIKVTATQDATVYGTWDNLEAYTWDQLEVFTWDQLEAL